MNAAMMMTTALPGAFRPFREDAAGVDCPDNMRSFKHGIPDSAISVSDVAGASAL